MGGTLPLMIDLKMAYKHEHEEGGGSYLDCTYMAPLVAESMKSV